MKEGIQISVEDLGQPLLVKLDQFQTPTATDDVLRDRYHNCKWCVNKSREATRQAMLYAQPGTGIMKKLEIAAAILAAIEWEDGN